MQSNTLITIPKIRYLNSHIHESILAPVILCCYRTILLETLKYVESNNSIELLEYLNNSFPLYAYSAHHFYNSSSAINHALAGPGTVSHSSLDSVLLFTKSNSTKYKNNAYFAFSPEQTQYITVNASNCREIGITLDHIDVILKKYDKLLSPNFRVSS